MFYSSGKMAVITALAGMIATAYGGGEEPVASGLPYIGDLIETAFPTWCIDEDEQRVHVVESCKDGSPNGRWNPIYLTKEFSGADPALGGYPSDIDIQYAFYYGAPFLGQACAGGPHHCAEVFDGESENCKACPKVKTDLDSGPNGPGHIPPHIAYASVTRQVSYGVLFYICTFVSFSFAFAKGHQSEKQKWRFGGLRFIIYNSVKSIRTYIPFSHKAFCFGPRFPKSSLLNRQKVLQ